MAYAKRTNGNWLWGFSNAFVDTSRLFALGSMARRVNKQLINYNEGGPIKKLTIVVQVDRHYSFLYFRLPYMRRALLVDHRGVKLA